MPKYSRIACFTHSFTVHPLPSVTAPPPATEAVAGAATRNRPLSTSSITARTASAYFASFNSSRLPQASTISCCNSISPFLRMRIYEYFRTFYHELRQRYRPFSCRPPIGWPHPLSHRHHLGHRLRRHRSRGRRKSLPTQTT